MKGAEIMTGKIYFVTFSTKRNCTENKFIYHCEASTAKEAKEIARNNWKSKNGHQFHLYGKKSNVQNADLLMVKGIRKEYSGSDVLGKYIWIG